MELNPLKQKKQTAIAVFFCLCAYSLYISAPIYAESKFIDKLASKGIVATVGETELTINSAVFNSVNLKIGKSKTTVSSISTTYSGDSIVVQGAHVTGDIEDYHSLKPSGKGSGTGTSRDIVIESSTASVSMKGNTAVVKGIDYRKGVVKIKSLEFIGARVNEVTLTGMNSVHVSSVYADNIIEALTLASALRISPPKREGKPGSKQVRTAHIDNFKGYRNGSPIIASGIAIESGTHPGLLVSAKKVAYNKEDFKSPMIKTPFIITDSISTTVLLGSESITLDGSVKGINVHIEKLKDIGVNIGDLSFKGTYKAGSIKSNLILNKMPVSFDTDLAKTVNVQLKTSCSIFINAIPWGLRKTTTDGRLVSEPEPSYSGDISATLSNDKVSIKDSCVFKDVPPDMSVKRFSKPFTIYVGEDKDPSWIGIDRDELTTGPGTKSWVPLNFVSHYVPMAIMFNEDGSFYAHRGYSNGAIKRVLNEFLESGSSSTGGSTITMQLAKNLWLMRDKTIARKVEEFILAMYIDSSLSKNKALELYLNVIEFGPNVYGVYKASMHYFKKPPIELTLRESTFLAIILPKPTASYFNNSKLNSGTSKKIDYILGLMLSRGKISQYEYDEAIVRTF